MNKAEVREIVEEWARCFSDDRCCSDDERAREATRLRTVLAWIGSANDKVVVPLDNGKVLVMGPESRFIPAVEAQGAAFATGLMSGEYVLRVMWGHRDADGSWHHNPKLAMSRKQQFEENVANGFLTPSAPSQPSPSEAEGEKS